jgi:hypothetical protein
MTHKRRTLNESEQQAAERLAGLWADKQDKYKESNGRKLSQADGAYLSKIGTQGAFNQYIRGLIPLNAKALVRFAKFFGVPPGDIFPELAGQLEINNKDTQDGVLDLECTTFALEAMDLLYSKELRTIQGYRWTAERFNKLYRLKSLKPDITLKELEGAQLFIEV